MVFIRFSSGDLTVFTNVWGRTAQTQRNKLDERMMHNVRRARSEADAVLALVDASAQPRAALEDLLPPEGRMGPRPPLAVVLNKVWIGQGCGAWCTLLPSSSADKVCTLLRPHGRTCRPAQRSRRGGLRPSRASRCLYGIIAELQSVPGHAFKRGHSASQSCILHHFIERCSAV